MKASEITSDNGEFRDSIGNSWSLTADSNMGFI